MFQTFTGNSRRPRQVNLSRRNNDYLSARSNAHGQSSGTGDSAIQGAQRARAARQNERRRINASRSIQRVWRGHSARKSICLERRPLLEASEEHLRRKTSEIRRLGEVESHLRLLVHTIGPATESDWEVERVLRTGQWIYEKAEEIAQITRHVPLQNSWPALLRAYIIIVATIVDTNLWPKPRVSNETRILSSDSKSIPNPTSTENFEVERLEIACQEEDMKLLFKLLGFLVTLIDLQPSVDWSQVVLSRRRYNSKSKKDSTVLTKYYRILGEFTNLRWLPTQEHEELHLLESLESGDSLMASKDPLVSLIAAPWYSLLKPRSIEQQNVAYSSVLIGLLTVPELPMNILLALRSVLSIEAFCIRAQHFVKSEDLKLLPAQCLSVLANTIHMLRHEVSSDDSEEDTVSNFYTTAFLSFASSVLTLFNSVDDMDEFSAFQLRAMTDVETVSELFRRSNLLDSTTLNRNTDADVLSDYILNILRLLPEQADDIRMRLYISHEYQKAGTGMRKKTAVRYFWEAASETSVFKRSTRGWNEVRDVLGESSDAHKRDWKVIFLFIEIYVIALRIQDDEQFVNGLNARNMPEMVQSNTLVGIEVQMLLEFLKNVCYCLFLKTTSEPPGRLRSLQDSSNSSSALADHDHGTRHPQTGHSAGVGINHLKGSVTALLRMLYERDSRRQFLPRDSFLMFMDENEEQNFVSSVIREVLLKQKLDEEDSDGEENFGDDQMHISDNEREHSHGIIRSQHIQRVERDNQMRDRQRILAKRRAREEAAPRVELLENTPFLVAFETRVKLFRMHVEDDMCARRGGDPDPERWRLSLHMSGNPQLQNRLSAHQAQLRRESIFEDAFDAFNKLGEGIKEPIRISFLGEEGIDGGGVTKEFLTSVINDVFRVNSPYKLFTENEDHMLYPNPNILEETDADLDEFAALAEDVTPRHRLERRKRVLEYYRFAGRLVGKCLYEGILVDIPLARFFTKKWALTGGYGAARNETTYRPGINDMWDFDKAIYRSLLGLQNSRDDVSTWGITFAVDENIAGKQLEFALKPGGADILVGNNNRLEYIFRLVNHYLVGRQARQTRAFLDGLSSIIKPTWLRMFNEAEIRVLLGGELKPIDVDDLRRNTICSGLYAIGDDGIEHDTVRMFWEVMREMEDADRRKLLQYVTSTPNAPLMGFVHLNPRFSIRDNESDQGRLPTSSTCANLLKLPTYKSKAVLRDRVMTAIHSGAGFDLS